MWQPIETAPRDATAILVMRDIWPGARSGRAEECNGRNTYVAAWWPDERGGQGAWICYMDAVLDPECPVEPTHWMPLPDAPGAQPAPSFADAYQGAMEDVAIWKKRALEAEDLNRKFVAEINGPAYMGEPAQPAPSVPECPYPCGWQNLLKLAIEDGAYLARNINEDEPVTENARAVTMRMVMRLRDLLMAINNAAPEAKP